MYGWHNQPKVGQLGRFQMQSLMMKTALDIFKNAALIIKLSRSLT